MASFLAYSISPHCHSPVGLPATITGLSRVLQASFKCLHSLPSHHGFVRLVLSCPPCHCWAGASRTGRAESPDIHMLGCPVPWCPVWRMEGLGPGVLPLSGCPLETATEERRLQALHWKLSQGNQLLLRKACVYRVLWQGRAFSGLLASHYPEFICFPRSLLSGKEK